MAAPRHIGLLRRLADGAEPTTPDADLADRLVRAGLAEPVADGRIAITAAGRAHLARAEAGGDFRAQHGAVAALSTGGDASGAAVDLAESPLGWLQRRGALGDDEFAAGERLRADFTRGRMMPHMTSNWSARLPSGVRGGGGSGPADLSHAAMAAQDRIRAALSAVGPDFADVLVGVCCFLEGITDLERRRNWPARSGKVILRLALAALARHYGLGATATGPERGAMRHWDAEGWKPSV